MARNLEVECIGVRCVLSLGELLWEGPEGPTSPKPEVVMDDVIGVPTNDGRS